MNQSDLNALRVVPRNATSTVCQTCGGKRFVNPDGSYNNAFSGSDNDPVIPCPDCFSEDRHA